MRNSFFLAIFVGLLFSSKPAFSQEQMAIPRFVSFKMGEVNLRTGPGGRYPIKYVYKKKNYPVEVIDEHELWRQIREIDGTSGWVHRRMLTGVRYVLLKNDADVFKKADISSKIKAYATKDVLAKVEKCPAKSDFCELEFEFDNRKIKGWVKRDVLYGLYPNEVIK